MTTLALLACSEPRVGKAEADASPSAPAPSGCTSDADCKTFASYCESAPCACQALPKASAEPSCAERVACLVDPCQAKTAACQAGRCALVLR